MSRRNRRASAVPSSSEATSMTTSVVPSFSSQDQNQSTLVQLPPAIPHAIIPPPFYGNGEIDVEEWFIQFQKDCSFNRWGDQQRFESLTLSLRGAAEEWRRSYVSQHQLNPTELTFSAMSDALRRAFKYQNDFKDVHLLRQLAQGPTETVDSFYWRTINLCNRIDTNISDKIKKVSFIEGLRPEIRQALIFDLGQLMIEIVEKAKSVEAIMSNKTVVSVASAVVPLQLEQQIGDLQTKFSTLQNTLVNIQQQISYQPVTTSLNAIPTAYRSVKRQQDVKKRRQTSFRAHWTVDGKPICRRCKKVGHLSYVCPSPVVVPDQEELRHEALQEK